MNVSQILESRKDWRKKATDRSAKIRVLNRKLARILLVSENLKKILVDSEERIVDLNSKLKNALVTDSKPILKLEVRVLCVSLFVLGIVPCNAVVRVLKYLSDAGHLNLNWLPDPSSIVNWIARTGLGYLNSVQEIVEPWIAIIDVSICFGKAKALVVLRVPLSRMNRGAALSLEDVDCIGIDIREEWNGDSVQDSLKETFGKSGIPAGILKDGGYDLAKGVRQIAAETPSLVVLQDIGHVFANLLKAKYAKKTSFLNLMALADSARKKLCQTELFPLRPPKIRTKGRFQSISKLVTWAEAVLDLTGGKGRSEKNSLKAKLREVLSGLSKLKHFLGVFQADCATLNAIQMDLKTKGLNQKSYRHAKFQLENLPARSKIKRKALEWLDRHMRIHCKMGIGQTPLPVSSDVIETLMGVIKNIIERHPTPEFTSLTLAAPLYCGALNSEKIRSALRTCPQKDLISWRSENCKNSFRHRKPELKKKICETNSPKTKHSCFYQAQDTC
jgi:hypothetical protein